MFFLLYIYIYINSCSFCVLFRVQAVLDANMYLDLIEKLELRTTPLNSVMILAIKHYYYICEEQLYSLPEVVQMLLYAGSSVNDLNESSRCALHVLMSEVHTSF